MTRPGGLLITGCDPESAFICLPPPPPSESAPATTRRVECLAPQSVGCAVGSSFTLTITSASPGALEEQVWVTRAGVSQTYDDQGEATFTPAAAATAPSETCEAGLVLTVTPVSCTFTLTSAVPGGGQLTVTTSSPSRATIRGCASGAVDGPPSPATCDGTTGNVAMLSCPAGCPAGATFRLVIAGESMGPLIEQISLPPPAGGTPQTFTVAPSPLVNFL